MHKPAIYTQLALAGALAGASGCATIVNDDYVYVPITTHPEGATVYAGGQVYITPSTLRLPRGTGDIGVSIEKEGYEPHKTTLIQSIDGWFWGNLVSWGLIGVGVDLLNGDAFGLEPDRLNVFLSNDEDYVAAEELTPEQNTTLKLTDEAIPLRVVSAFHSDSWYPLEESDIIAIVTDTALDRLSSNGRFQFIFHEEHDEKEAGRLELTLSLIESISVAKLTISLTPAGSGTYLTTSSGTLKGQDREEIYDSLVKIAEAASDELNEKMFK